MRRWMAGCALAAVAVTTVGASSAPAGTAVATEGVKAKDNFFAPRTITVERGTRVRWVSRGNNPHTTTSSTGLWDKPIAPGGSTSRVFKKAGTFKYICKIHVDEGMRGKVVVV